MQRVFQLAAIVAFSGFILVTVQEPFRHSAPFAVGLDLAVSAACRIFGALVAIVITIELFLRISGGRQVPNINQWVVVLLSALCLFTPSWHAPMGLAVVVSAMILVSGFGRHPNVSATETDATNASPGSENSPDSNHWVDP